MWGNFEFCVNLYNAIIHVLNPGNILFIREQYSNEFAFEGLRILLE